MLLTNNWPYEPDILIRLLKSKKIKLVNIKDIYKGFINEINFNYYGSYTLRLIGIDLPYVFESFEREQKCRKVFYNLCSSVSTKCQAFFLDPDNKLKEYELKNFPCYSIFVPIKEDNKDWSYVGTEYEKVCKESNNKPYKYLPIAVTEKKLNKFQEKFPEYQLAIEKYKEAYDFCLRNCPELTN